MLSLEAISRGVGDRVLFEDIWWTIHPGDRIGLVGPNGSGKTTLLRILAGLDEADAGRVRRRRGLRVDYLPQEVEAEFAEGMSVLEAALVGADDLRSLGREIDALADRLAQASNEGDEKAVARLSEEYGERRALFEWFGGDQLEARARVVLGGLGFTTAGFDQPAGTLSGGWRMRVLMARMLLSGSDLLLLDEPTNHLDLDALTWLEDHLAGSPAAVIVVSHDRYFLDRVATRIADLVGERLRVTTGGYSEWVMARTAERERTLARDRQLAAEEQRLKRFVERFGYKATKASQANERKKMLERVRARRRALESDSSWSWSFHWPPAPPSPELLISLEGVSKAFGELVVLDRLDLQIRRGERLAILGPNGAGKTTLLRVLAGELPPDRGKRHVAQGLVIGRFAQHQLETMDPALTVLEQAQKAAPGRSPEQVRKALGGLGLGADHVGRPVGTLSGGERARLALARLLLHPCHLLMLDEPTNHLDLPMRQALEEALEAWEGTLLVVSHDRAFLERLTKAGIAVEEGCAERLDGNWQAWVEWRRARRGAATECGAGGGWRTPSGKGLARRGHARSGIAGDGDPRSPAAQEERSGGADVAARDHRSRSSRRLRAEALQARQRRLRPLREAVIALEEEIEEAESRIDAIDRALSDPAIHGDGERMRLLSRERGEVEGRLERLAAEWADKAEELETAEDD